MTILMRCLAAFGLIFLQSVIEFNGIIVLTPAFGQTTATQSSAKIEPANKQHTSNNLEKNKMEKATNLEKRYLVPVVSGALKKLFANCLGLYLQLLVIAAVL